MTLPSKWGGIVDGSLEAGDTALTNGQILVGNASGVAADVAMSGDALIANTGAVTVQDMTLGSDAQGDIAVRGASEYNALAIGTAGQRLQVNSGATAPEYVSHKTKWAFRIPESMTVDSDAYNGSLVCANAADITLTEAAAAYCKVYDATNTDYQTFSTSATGAGYTNNYQHIPDTVADNDAVYFGHTVPFWQIYCDVTTAVTYGDDAMTWEYWNGSTWSALAIIYDHTGNATTTGARPFQQDGSVSWKPPTNWASTTVDSQAAYWVRCRVSANANHNGEDGTFNSVEHKVATWTDGFKVPYKCTVTDILISDEAGTVHTATDVKFYLVNFTKGTASAEFTFAQDKRRDALASQTMACDANDNLGILISQEDGTNEAGPATLEIGVTLSA